MGDHRTIKRSRKEFRRLVELNGGVERFMQKPKRRKFWIWATMLLLVLAVAEGYAVMELMRAVSP